MLAAACARTGQAERWVRRRHVDVAGERADHDVRAHVGDAAQAGDAADVDVDAPGAEALAKRAGDDVDFVGVVTRYPDTPVDELLLTRYVITCCVADATIVQVRVVNVPPGKFRRTPGSTRRANTYPLGREVIVNASSIAAVPRPAKPYITP